MLLHMQKNHYLNNFIISPFRESKSQNLLLIKFQWTMPSLKLVWEWLSDFDYSGFFLPKVKNEYGPSYVEVFFKMSLHVRMTKWGTYIFGDLTKSYSPEPLDPFQPYLTQRVSPSMPFKVSVFLWIYIANVFRKSRLQLSNVVHGPFVKMLSS